MNVRKLLNNYDMFNHLMMRVYILNIVIGTLPLQKW